MSETWLHPNRRALVLGMIPAIAVILIGFWLAWLTNFALRDWRTWLAGGLFLVGIVLLFALSVECYRPRIAFGNRQVYFRLRTGKPIAVPVEVVEAFFLGQGPAHLPIAQIDRAESVNLIARLSQKEPQWFKVDVHPSLGHWCDGYVTIRGTWCERLTGEVIRRLNHRLHDVTAEANSSTKDEATTA
jgi:hypothetical protein